MNYKDMSAGQLAALWVFGVLGWMFCLVTINPYENSDLVIALIFFIPLFLIWVTIGWKNSKKTNQ